MRPIDADEVLARIENPYQRAEIARWLRDAPTIEPKKGKWNCSDDWYESGICSACKWDTGEPYVNCKKWFKFCPNCGARMSE